MQTLACDLWLMERNAFRQFLQTINTPLKLSEEQIRAATSASARQEKRIAIIPVQGVLEARPSFIGSMLGMSSYEAIGKTFDAVMQDDSFTAVVLDIASPGGMVYGAMELADKIFRARGTKPIIAVANPMAASAAFWIGTAADRLVSVPSGDVGSVGVIGEHLDFSQAMANEGVKATVIRSTNSPYKQETNPNEPLTAEARAALQTRVDDLYDKFASDLARFRGVSVEHVNQHFGQGRVVGAKKAMAAGMIDRIDTLQGIVDKLIEGRVKLRSERAQDIWDAPTVKEQMASRVLAINAALNPMEN